MLFFALICLVSVSVSSLLSSPISKQHATTSQRTRDITIRTTQPEDLPTIIDLLSFETSKESPNLFNWITKMQRLQNVQSLTLQLTNRLNAIHAGRALKNSPLLKEYEGADISLQQVLWSDISFRNKCEKAVKTTLEYNKYSTLWDSHHFALTPDAKMLNHFMMTAFDSSCMGEPVGFCEVGILSNPQIEDGIFFCVGNLVVSPNKRRRGIGKQLMNCAIRMMRIHGQRVDIETAGLHVDGENVDAIQLYEKMGFTVTGKCSHVEGRVFMQLELKESTDLKFVEERENMHTLSPTEPEIQPHCMDAFAYS